MISTPHRQTATLLIEEAVTTGARRAKACAEVETPPPEPANKLSAAERAAVLSQCK